LTTSLHQLLAVQDLDLALDQLRHRKSHLPEREQIAGVDGETGRLREELGRIEVTRAEVAQRQARAEAELAATEERSAAIDKRLYSGEVSASRELQAMSAELAQLKARASTLEDSVLGTLEELEPLDQRAGELRQRLDQLGEDRIRMEARLSEGEAAIDSEVADTIARREEAASVVPEALLATYEKLRSRLGGVGIARLAGNHCDGCHLTLSAVELDRVRHLPEGEVYTCEQCSRILVP
jgi:predicted  nucleic acid-binding Zn-ribbon protein